jgi:hypothetical protein
MTFSVAILLAIIAILAAILNAFKYRNGSMSFELLLTVSVTPEK